VSEAPSSASSGVYREVFSVKGVQSCSGQLRGQEAICWDRWRPINGHQIAIKRVRLAEMGECQGSVDKFCELSSLTQPSPEGKRVSLLPLCPIDYHQLLSPLRSAP
jgi:hypothetical protein